MTHRLPAKLDSGASHCFFHTEFAELLGLELPDEEREALTTAGGNVWGWRREVEIVVPDWKVDGGPIVLPRTVYFADYRAGLALLGLVGFFDSFVFKIDEFNQLLRWELKR